MVAAGAALRVRPEVREAIDTAHDGSILPPIFDARLYYRSAFHPYEIDDQGECASCVFISATRVAQIRAAIQRDEDNRRSALGVWRATIRDKRKDPAGMIAALDEFAELTRQRAKVGSVPQEALVPTLDWERFICCGLNEGAQCVNGNPARSGDEGTCYHHVDGAPFSCDRDSDGVVPYHFLRHVQNTGFYAKQPFVAGKRLIDSIAPETPDAEMFAVHPPLTLHSGEVRLEDAKHIRSQINAIKRSIMEFGPVMAMIRIGDDFDCWPEAACDIAKAGGEAQAGGEAAGGDAEKAADATRRAYCLGSADAAREFHEVVVVGWGYADDGTPSWIVRNSYGPDFNDACAVSVDAVPLAYRSYASTLAKSYADAEICHLKGHVFVAMASTELLTAGRESDLENNVVAFLTNANTFGVGSSDMFDSVFESPNAKAGAMLQLRGPNADHSFVSDVGAHVLVAAAVFLIGVWISKPGR